MLNDVLCYFVNFQCTIYNTAIVAQLVERWFRDPGSRVVFTVGGLFTVGVSFFPPGPGCVFKCISFGQSSSPYFKSIYLQYVGNSSVVKVYLIRPKPGPVAKNAAPRPSSWESNQHPLNYQTSALPLSYRSRSRQLGREFSIYILMRW